MSSTAAIKFSVIIPTHNRFGYASEAVESVVRQSYPAHEIIVVVDGGSDNSAALLKEKFPTGKYPNLVVLEQPNLGKSIARNRGIAAATGDFVSFLDSDDLFHPRKLETINQYLEANPGCQAVFSSVWLFSESADGPNYTYGLPRDFVAKDLDECIAKARLEPEVADKPALKTYEDLLEFCDGCGATIERKLVITAGCFDANKACAEDWTLYKNVARMTDWHTTAERLQFIRLHSQQDTKQRTDSPVNTLASLIAYWHCGRPAKSSLNYSELGSRLASYGPIYRETISICLRYAIKRGDWAAVSYTFAAAAFLLPNWGDRIYSFVPRPITWRWKQHVLKSHKLSRRKTQL